jgi:hypothetical protein
VTETPGEPPAWHPPGWVTPEAGPPPPGWGPPPGWAPPQQQWSYAPPPKPGIIPLRPLGLGEILDGAFTLIRRYPRVTLGLAALVATVNAALSLLVSIGYNSYPDTGDTEFTGAGTGFAAGSIVANVLTALLSAILGAVLTGMLTVVVGEAVLGREISIREVWQRIQPRLLPLIGIAFLAGVLPFLGLIACIIPGVFLWGAYALAVPAFVLERVGVIEALRRSWRLAVPSWWRVWGIRALAYLIISFVSSILAIPFFIAGLATTGIFSGDDITGTPILFLVFVAVGSLIAQTITAPLTSGVLALLYVDRRIRAEGLDVTLAASTRTQ